jgi:hypothetical protein
VQGLCNQILNQGIPLPNFIVDKVSSVKTCSELRLDISLLRKISKQKKLSIATKANGQCLFQNYKRAARFGFCKPTGGLFKSKRVACVQCDKNCQIILVSIHMDRHKYT